MLNFIKLAVVQHAVREVQVCVKPTGLKEGDWLAGGDPARGNIPGAALRQPAAACVALQVLHVLLAAHQPLLPAAMGLPAPPHLLFRRRITHGTCRPGH